MTVESTRISHAEGSNQDILGPLEASASGCIACSVAFRMRGEIKSVCDVGDKLNAITTRSRNASCPRPTMSEQAAIGKLNANAASKYVKFHTRW